MAAFKKLPKEIFSEIASYLPNKSTNRTDLLNCSQTCRSFWDAATPAIYHAIDLHFDGNQDEAAIQKSERRQLSLIKSLAENPKLGAQVRTFVNDSDTYSDCKDMTQRAETDISLLTEAAKNIKYLSQASFTTNPLAIQVVTTVPSYPQLYDLTLDGFVPTKHIWPNSTTPLKSLKWKMRTYQTTFGDALLSESRFLLKAVEATCPDLEVLEFSLEDYYPRSMPNTALAVAPEVIEGYNALPDSSEPKFKHLRHFGLYFKDRNEDIPQDEIKNLIFEVVGRYGHSLTSLSIPGGGHEWTREGLDFVLKACTLVPDLRELNLTGGFLGSGSELTALQTFKELTSSPATAKIEKFSTYDIQGHFSGEIGRLFRAWKNLKFLQVGDVDNADGLFGDDGRLQFDDYRRHILAFIRGLPPTVQEIYLEINGEGLSCDDDEDFDPLCNMGKRIFRALPRLHTCDIHAWISNCDGGLGSLPEKGVFYRRLPSESSNYKERMIWTSRMDFIYQDEDILVEKASELVEDESFEGENAKEVWLDGATFQKVGTGTSRGRPVGGPDWSWPFCLDLIQSRIGNYEMWRERR
ncbi:hypothetical protein BKA65DRAFT_593598 [Rhexocercosporidium sp. MPI-PUGE-AT-0058]|nr:hypothetical protein BKA65DRAFT_593598 [Rhexocercosporidium sp. MPI-PUGE-AT-0058]